MNTFIGYNAGAILTTGSNNLLMGVNPDYIIGHDNRHIIILKCVIPFPQLSIKCYLLYYNHDFYNVMTQDNHIKHSDIGMYYTSLLDLYDTLFLKWLTLYLCYKAIGWLDLFTNIAPHYDNPKLWITD